MKNFFLTLAMFVSFISPAFAQQTQPPVLDTPVQYSVNSRNTYAESSVGGSVAVTINGVSGQSVRLYSVKIWCSTSPQINRIPSVRITDNSSNLLLALPSIAVTNQDVPVGDYNWLPGWTFAPALTVVITGNAGLACTGTTFINVQADQF